MAYNPKTATPLESWRFRIALIEEILDEQLMTVNTRMALTHHLSELREIFDSVNDPEDEPGT